MGLEAEAERASERLIEGDRAQPDHESSSDESVSIWLTTPIVCVEKCSRPSARRIPAIKVVTAGGEWVIVPLSSKDLGALFDEYHDFTDWDCYDIRGGWRTAREEFRDLVDYPVKVLDMFLDTLRLGRLPNGSQLTLKSWSATCWSKESPLSVEVNCGKCQMTRTITPRHIALLPDELSQFCCHSIGMICPRTVYDVGVGRRREAPVSSGYYRHEPAEISASDLPRRRLSSASPKDRSKERNHREARGTVTLQSILRDKIGPVPRGRPSSERGRLFQGSSIIASNSRYLESLPHPREYIVGVEATFIDSPDPTDEELTEFYSFRDSSEWRQYTKALQRRGGEATSFLLEGKDEVIPFRDWEKRIRYQFDSWVLTNPVVKAELAMTTFVHTAQDWWGSQRQCNPQLRVTFAQLCEWITLELIPSASHASALEAWTCLNYQGNLENYFKQLDDLRFYHHIDPCAAHAIAAKPFGPEFQARVRILDKEAGFGGIAFPTLKELIRAHCSERGLAVSVERTGDTRKKHERTREGLPAHSVKFEKKERSPFAKLPNPAQESATTGRVTHPNSIPLTKPRFAESRPYFCLVCGDGNHIWTQCPHKQTKGCAACSSEAHMVRSCPQRWKGTTTTPHRWDKTPEVAQAASQGWDLTLEGAEEQGTSMAARRVGIYASPGVELMQQARQAAMERSWEGWYSEKGGCEQGSQVENVRRGIPMQEIFVDPSCGVPPCPSKGAQGELLYPIQLNHLRSTALWDPGAGASFISVRKTAELGLTPELLSRPIRLEIWDGPGAVITHRVVVDRVKLGTKEGSWAFMLVAQPPHDIVLGIDVSRAWYLTVNPNNDHLICITPLETKTPDVPGVAIWDAKGRGDTKGSGDEELGHDSAIEDWEEHVRCQTFLCATRSKSETLAIREGKENEFVLSKPTHSVTAGTPEEEAKRRELLKSMSPELSALVQEFPRLFKPPDSVPPERSVQHHIRLKPNAVPVKRAPYVVGGEKRQAMREQVQQLSKQGWIEPALSPWGAPVLFVPKKEKVFRMCGDFRDLNALTVDDLFPLPRVEVMLHRAGGATVFSKLDLASGFHQIALTAESKPLTTFCLPEPVEGNCLWQWTVMPFGLKNAPPTFQRAMTVALKGCEEFAVVYIDDILVFSQTHGEHIDHLRQVLERLEREAYHARLPKCIFLREEVEFLGHRLSSQGLQTSPEKLEALTAWQPPFRKAKHVKQFLGLVLWYKAFIPHLATIAAPLFPLTSSKKRFEWTEAATAAVRALQEKISQAPCLARWETELPTRVVTDASKVGIAAVLEQKHELGWRPVAFWSRRLKDAETRYHTTDREWLAVVEAVSRRWKGFLEGQAFLVCSDHMALERKLLKSSHDPPVTDRQSRWIEALMPFALTFEYIKGENNAVADALSRCPVAARSVTVVKSVQFGFLGWMRLAAKHDQNYQRRLQEATEDPAKGENVQGLLCLLDGRWLVPQDDDLRTALLSEAHDFVFSGHFGQLKTFKLLSQYWYWPTMKNDVQEYVHTCVRCQKVKSSTSKAPGLLHPFASPHPGHTITLDFVSKFSPAHKTKNDQCLVMVDQFSKFVMLKGCCSSITAEETASLFHEKVFPLFGAPRVVLSDRRPQFTAQFWKQIMSLMQTKVAIATSHHPQTDGQSERAIQTLLRLIRTYATNNQKDWERYLPMFEVALNAVSHAVTGLPPHRVLFGQDARVPHTFLAEELRNSLPPEGPDAPPIPAKLRKWFHQCQDVWQLVHERQKTANQRAKEAYDKNRKSVQFEVGDLALLSTSSHAALTGLRKHRERFVGPYVIEGKTHPNAYRLKGLPPGVPKTQNVRYLRSFRPNAAKFASRPMPEYAAPITIDGNLEWEVEAIVAHRVLRHGMKYRVKWKDTPQEQWLPASALRHCRRLVADYHRAQNLPPLTVSFDD